MSLLILIVQKVRDTFPPNRVVVILTPFFAAAAGALTAWLAQHFPGLPALNSTQLAAIFGAGALATIQIVYKWLDGWQKHEAQINDIVKMDRTGPSVH